MNFVDNVEKQPLEGIFRVEEVLKDGTTRTILEEKNLIVNKARTILRDMVAGDTTDKPIIKFKFGTKGVDSNGNIKAPTVNDTKLYETNNDLIYIKNADSTTKSGSYDVVFKVTLSENEANLNGGEYSISEAGLFNGKDEMFSHKTFTVITKNNTRAFIFTWTIKF